MEKNEALEIFTGLMLGDGNLTFIGSNAMFRISRMENDEYREYLLEIVEALKALGVKVSLDQPKSRVKVSRGKASQTLDLDSRVSPFLTEQYHLWIISNKPKRRKIPDYLTKIKPLTLTYWFESDGSTTWTAGQLVKLELHSCQFGHEGNQVLCKLMGDIGIQMHLSRRWDRRNNKEYWGLVTKNATEISKFLDIIEPHIHLPYQYKMKRPQLKQHIIDGKLVAGPFIWLRGSWSKGA